MFTRKRLKIKWDVTYIIGQSYRNVDAELYRHDIEQLLWDDILECNDPNDAANLLTSMILEIADMHAPYKRIKTHSNQAKWVTTELLSLIDEKELLQTITVCCSSKASVSPGLPD